MLALCSPKAVALQNTVPTEMMAFVAHQNTVPFQPKKPLKPHSPPSFENYQHGMKDATTSSFSLVFFS